MEPIVKKTLLILAVVIAMAAALTPFASTEEEQAPAATEAVVTEAAPGAEVEPQAPEAPAAPALSLMEKMSYVFGLNVGMSMKNESIEIDLDLFTKGMADGLAGTEPALPEEVIQQAITAFQAERISRQKALVEEQGAKNKADGAAFMAEYARKEGVQSTETGMLYTVITEGTGDMPGPDDSVVAHYRGTLVDGTEFDSSYKRGSPATFALTGVIDGWTEILQIMKVGSKWEIVIPPELAYGEFGRGPTIGPQATLIFEIELISIEKDEPRL